VLPAAAEEDRLSAAGGHADAEAGLERPGKSAQRMPRRPRVENGAERTSTRHDDAWRRQSTFVSVPSSADSASSVYTQNGTISFEHVYSPQKKERYNKQTAIHAVQWRHL